MGDYVWFHDVSWHSAYAIYFFVIGICAGLSFFSFLSWHKPELAGLRKPAAYGAFVLLGVGGVLLIGDLSQPLRFLNVLNPAYLHFSSPLAWGSLNIMAYGAASVAYLLMLRKGDEKNAKLLALVAAVLALGLPIYTGYDLSVHQSRPVWNTPVMPALFVALAMTSGAAISSLLAGGGQYGRPGHIASVPDLVGRRRGCDLGFDAGHHPLRRFGGRTDFHHPHHWQHGPDLRRPGHRGRHRGANGPVARPARAPARGSHGRRAAGPGG